MKISHKLFRILLFISSITGTSHAFAQDSTFHGRGIDFRLKTDFCNLLTVHPNIFAEIKFNNQNTIELKAGYQLPFFRVFSNVVYNDINIYQGPDFSLGYKRFIKTKKPGGLLPYLGLYAEYKWRWYDSLEICTDGSKGSSFAQFEMTSKSNESYHLRLHLGFESYDNHLIIEPFFGIGIAYWDRFKQIHWRDNGTIILYNFAPTDYISYRVSLVAGIKMGFRAKGDNKK